MVAWRKADTEYEDSEPFASLLPHQMLLDPREGLCLLSTPKRRLRPTLAVGCAWEVAPLNIEACDEAMCAALSHQYEGMLRGFPVGTAFQAIMQIAPANTVPAWSALREDAATHPCVEAQQAAIQAGLPYQAGTRRGRLRTVRTLLTMRVPIVRDAEAVTLLQSAWETPGLWQGAIAERLCQHLTTPLGEFESLRGGIDDTLRGMGQSVERLSGWQLGQAIAQTLDPSLDELPTIQADMAFKEQVLSQETTRIRGGWQVGDRTEGISCQVLSLHRAPPKTYPGILSAPRAPKDTQPLALWDAWDGPMTLVVNVAVAEQAKEKARLRTKRNFAYLQRLNPFGDASTENVALKEELDTLLRSFFLSGGQLLLGQVQIVLWGAREMLARGVQEVTRTARRLELEFLAEPVLGSTLFLQTLPLGYDPDWPRDQYVRRTRRIQGMHVANLLPLYGGFRGTETASILFVNQRGESIGYDPFDSLTNPHMLITGMMGSGKSFTLAHMAQQLLPLGASWVILDRLPSYQELCAVWHGRYIEMSFNTPTCFNPFYGSLDNEHVAFLTACLTEMASGMHERLTRDMVSVVADALAYFARTWDPTRGEARLGLFIEEVLRDGCFSEDADDRKLGREVARKLSMFWGRGPYAGFFDGPNQLVLDPVLTVIELSQLRESSDLEASLLFALMHLLTQFFADPSRRHKKKVFACDETVFLLKHQTSADVLEEIELTYRKLRTSAIFLAQFAEHLNSPAGRAIRKGSPSMLFLQQEGEEIAEMQQILRLTPQECHLMTLARRHPGSSTAYLRLPNHTGGLVRLVPDAFTRWQGSQDPQERLKRQEMAAALGGDMVAAVAQLAREYPHGMRGERG